MSKFTHHLRNATIIAASLMVPFTLTTTALRADDHSFHDGDHKDDHAWNAHEDRAYGMWEKEQHRKHQLPEVESGRPAELLELAPRTF